MKNGAFSRCSVKLDIFRHLLLALDRIEQQQEFVAADPRQHVGFAQVQPEPLGDLDQQRIADRMAVIVVDVLEIVDVEKGQREPAVRLVALQQAVGAMLDHPPGRQVGQFVIIGRAEQLVLEGLLLADVGGARQQQVAVRDANRPMGGEKDLLGRGRWLKHSSATAARPVRSNSRPVLAAMVQFLRQAPRRRAAGHPAAAPRRRRSPAGSGPARPEP